jgi:hypothetical protein
MMEQDSMDGIYEIDAKLAIAPFNNAEILSVFFNNSTNTAVIQ